MTLNEKVAYLKGLMEGLQIDETKPESKILKAMTDILDDMALTVSDLEDTVDALDEYVEEIDEDLAAIEEIAYEEDEYDDEDDEYDEDEDYDDLDDEYDDGDDDDEFYEVMCPECGEVIYLDESIDPSKVICPACYAEFDLAGECGGDCTSCEGCEE